VGRTDAGGSKAGMEDVYVGVRVERWSLDLRDGGEGDTGLLRVGDRVLGAAGSSLTISWSPGLRPRLFKGSSGIIVSSLGG
jgi:hypothetical protein